MVHFMQMRSLYIFGRTKDKSHIELKNNVALYNRGGLVQVKALLPLCYT